MGQVGWISCGFAFYPRGSIHRDWPILISWLDSCYNVYLFLLPTIRSATSMGCRARGQERQGQQTAGAYRSLPRPIRIWPDLTKGVRRVGGLGAELALPLLYGRVKIGFTWPTSF